MTTLTGTLSLEVRIEPDASPNPDNWYQVGTIDFSDSQTEGRVVKVAKKIEVPRDARMFRIRYIKSNLRQYRADISYRGTIFF